MALALISTLKFSIDIFEEDKRSYIFENALNVSEQNSDDIHSLINNSQSEVKTIMELNKLSPKMASTRLSNASNIVAILFADKKFINHKTVSRLGIDTEMLEYSSTQDKVTDLSEKYSSAILSINTEISGKKAQILADYSDLLSLIKRNSAFNVSIYNSNGSNILGEHQENRLILPSVQKSKPNKSAKQESFSGVDYLYSYVKGSTGLITLVTIPKSKAFIATEMLKTKSMYFGLTLLFFFIIIGTLFSVSLTSPIYKLLGATENISKGIYTETISLRGNDEFGMLANSFNTMSTEISGLIGKLEEYNKNLEKMVEQRTLELSEANEFIKAMVNSLDQGLLVFDKDGNCHDIYTKACESIFGRSPQGLSFDQAIGLNEKDAKSFKDWNNILFQELLPFESSIGLGPAQVKEGENTSDDNFKQVKLDYYPIRDSEEKLSNVVSVATDVTAQIKAQNAFEEKEAYVAMVLKIINNKVQFFSFIKEVKSTLENIGVAIGSSKIDIDYILMNWHSLNGGMGIFKILPLQQMARNHETGLVSAKENPPSDLKETLLTQLKNFESGLEEFLASTHTFFGEDWQKEQEKVVLTKDQLHRLQGLIDQSKNDELTEYYAEQFLKSPIEDFFKGYDELIQTSASKTGKKINTLDIRGGQLRIMAQQHEELFSVLVHLFRNCVDHGVETPAKRKELGKEEIGNISIEFKKVRTKGKPWLNIRVCDDGSGINPEIIRKKLGELHPNEDFSQISDEEIVYKIFDPTFTTTEVVTSLSGRGVGMSAIKDVIDKRKGSLKVVSEIGKGSQFSFSVPE